MASVVGAGSGQNNMAAVKKTLLAFIVITTVMALCHVVDGAATPPSPDDTYDGDNAVVDGSPVEAAGPPAPSYPQPPEPSQYTSNNDGNSDVKEPAHYDNDNVEYDRQNVQNRDSTVDDGNSDVREPPHYDNANVEYESPSIQNPDETRNDGKSDVNEQAQYDNADLHKTDGNVNNGNSDSNEPTQYDNGDVHTHYVGGNNDNSDSNQLTQYGNAKVESDRPSVDYAEDNNVVTDVNANNGTGDDGVGDTNVGVYSSQSSSSNSEGGTPVNNKKCSFSLVQRSKFDPKVDKLNKTILDSMDAAFKNSPLAIQIFGKYLDPGSAGKSASFASPQSGIPPIGSNPGISPISSNPGLGLDSPLGRAGSSRPPARTIKVNPSHSAFNVNQMFNQISGDATGFSRPISKFKGISNPTGHFGLKPAFIGGGGRRNGGGIHGNFFSNFGNFFRRRRKRMAVPPSPEVFNGARKPKAVCPPNRKLVTGFLKSGNPCYIYKADVQGIETDACQQKECNACADSGPAQCMPEDLSSWVWAWCPTQAPGDLLTYEYLEYPAYCSCKSIEC